VWQHFGEAGEMSARALEILLRLCLYRDSDCREYRIFKVEHLLRISGVCEDEFVGKFDGVGLFDEMLRDEPGARRVRRSTIHELGPLNGAVQFEKFENWVRVEVLFGSSTTDNIAEPKEKESAPTRKPPFLLTARVLAASSIFARPRNATFTIA